MMVWRRLAMKGILTYLLHDCREAIAAIECCAKQAYNTELVKEYEDELLQRIKIIKGVLEQYPEIVYDECFYNGMKQ